MTQTINSLFGCGAMVPGTGLMLNNTQVPLGLGRIVALHHRIHFMPVSLA